MDDATFLEQCGVAIDQRWLIEQLVLSEEARRYANSLLRISDILAPQQALAG